MVMDGPSHITNEDPGTMTEIQLSLLRHITDFCFELVGNGTNEEEYKQKVRLIHNGDHFCLHWLCCGTCMSPDEEFIVAQEHLTFFFRDRLPRIQVSPS